MDGWEDDDDLEIDSETNENDWKKDLEPSAHDDNTNTGEWSFDDFLLDNKEEEQTPIVPAAKSRIETVPDSTDTVMQKQHVTQEKPTTHSSSSVAEKPPAGPLLDRLAQRPKSQQQHPVNNIPAKTVMMKKALTKNVHDMKPAAPTEEWSFDDDSFLEEEPRPDVIANQKQQDMFQNLSRYMDSLPTLIPSLNAVLEAEFNTYHHAVELTEYYTSRPQLYDYTLETELPRMDYEVVLANTQRLTEKYDVQHYMLSQDKDTSILIRSANQSLLADLLAQLTGPDRFIQHQYLATAVATSCRFLLHPSMVECHSNLTLSLPSASGDRLDIAELQVSITFGQPPSVCYKVHSVKVLLKDTSLLYETAAFLSSLQEEFFEEEPPPTNDDVVRDAFLASLSQTQQFVQDSHAGLSSAWKQIDSVANVSNKIRFFREGLKTLPTSTEKVQQEQVASRPRQPQQPNKPVPQLQVQPPPPPSPPLIRPPPPPPHGSASREPLPPGDRPAPILGGLLRSGWHRLAQSVALPDEEEMYATTEASPAIPKLYRSNENQAITAAKPPPTLNDNRRQRPPPFQPSSVTPQATFHQPAPPSVPPPRDDGKQMNTIMATPSPLENKMEDGWGDDDDLDLNDDDLLVETPKPSTPRRSHVPPPTAVAPLPRRSPKPPTAGPPPPRYSPPQAPSVDTHSPTIMNYSPEDDIIPTRKRWVNPRPGNRQLRV